MKKKEMKYLIKWELCDDEGIAIVPLSSLVDIREKKFILKRETLCNIVNISTGRDILKPKMIKKTVIDKINRIGTKELNNSLYSGKFDYNILGEINCIGCEIISKSSKQGTDEYYNIEIMPYRIFEF